MIAYKTFVKQLDTSQDLLAQQNELRNKLMTFVNDLAAPESVIQINEQTLVESGQFALVVWYKKPLPEPEFDFASQPEAQSAEVLARSLRENERREIINTMIAEHLIRSDSK